MPVFNTSLARDAIDISTDAAIFIFIDEFFDGIDAEFLSARKRNLRTRSAESKIEIKIRGLAQQIFIAAR